MSELVYFSWWIAGEFLVKVYLYTYCISMYIYFYINLLLLTSHRKLHEEKEREKGCLRSRGRSFGRIIGAIIQLTCWLQWKASEASHFAVGRIHKIHWLRATMTKRFFPSDNFPTRLSLVKKSWDEIKQGKFSVRCDSTTTTTATTTTTSTTSTTELLNYCWLRILHTLEEVKRERFYSLWESSSSSLSIRVHFS